MRSPEAIPETEPLYRRLRDEWTNGDRVLPEAVDLEGSSCDRSSLREPEELLAPPEWVAVGRVTSADLPKDILPSGAPPAWEFFSVDVPLPHNEAHCEIRVRRVGRASTDNDSAIKKRDKLTREKLKSELASRFRVVG